MVIKKKSSQIKTEEVRFKVTVDILKVCGGAEDSITALSYGPFDNGYILAGMQSGRLLIFDPVTLKRMQEFKVFTEDRSEDQKAQAICKITIEPTELVLVSATKQY